jgi:hypothetical protein
VLESERDEEGDRGREVIDDDAHVVHPLHGHGLDANDAPAAHDGWEAPRIVAVIR